MYDIIHHIRVKKRCTETLVHRFLFVFAEIAPLVSAAVERRRLGGGRAFLPFPLPLIGLWRRFQFHENGIDADLSDIFQVDEEVCLSESESPPARYDDPLHPPLRPAEYDIADFPEASAVRKIHRFLVPDNSFPRYMICGDGRIVAIPVEKVSLPFKRSLFGYSRARSFRGARLAPARCRPRRRSPSASCPRSSGAEGSSSRGR